MQRRQPNHNLAKYPQWGRCTLAHNGPKGTLTLANPLKRLTTIISDRIPFEFCTNPLLPLHLFSNDIRTVKICHLSAGQGMPAPNIRTFWTRHIIQTEKSLCFIRCESSGDSWGGNSEKSFLHIHYIYRVSPLCGFSGDESDWSCERNCLHTHDKCRASLLCELSGAWLSWIYERNSPHKGYTYMVFLRCVFSGVWWGACPVGSFSHKSNIQKVSSQPWGFRDV